MRRRANSQRIESAVPVAYMGLAIALVAILLPTALRPPRPQTPQTAQLSPDAPPDNKTESLIASLNRASSGTAGFGQGLGGESGTGSGPTGITTTTVPKKAGPTLSCPHGYGDP